MPTTGLITATLSGTAIAFGKSDPIPRFREFTIEDVIGDTPSTARGLIRGIRPTIGQELIASLTGSSDRIFAGIVLAATQVSIAKRSDLEFQVSCIDYTWLLNRRKVTKQYTSTTAGAVLANLVATFTSGFTATAVESAAGSTAIDEITFTFEDVPTALTRLANRIGGYWYCDYTKDIHFFFSETGSNPTPLTVTHPTLDPVSLQVELHLSGIVTRVVHEGLGSTMTDPAAVSASTLSLEDVSMFNGSGGGAITGAQRLTYTGTSALAAPGAPTTSATGLGKPAGAYKHKVTFVDDAERETAAGSASAGATASTTSTPGQLNYVSANPGGGLTAGTYYWVVTFAAPGGLETAASSPFGIALGASGYYVTLNGFTSVPAGCTTRLYRTLVGGSNYFFVAEFGGAPSTYNDSTADANLGGALPTATGIGQQLSVTSIPTSGDARVKGRRLYRTKAGGATYFFLADLGDNSTTTYTDNIADSALGKAAPAVSAFPGLLTGVSGVTKALVPGDEVHLLVTVNDTAAQTALAALIGGDGIQEDYIQDRRLSETEATARATAHLDINKDPQVTLRYRCRDILTKSGRTINVPGYAGTAIADGAIGSWALDEASGNALDDAGAHPGTYTGSPTRGVAGPLSSMATAVRFNGTTQYVTMGDVAAFEFTGAFSAEAWFKTTSASGQAIVGKFAATNIGWLVFMVAGGTLRFLAYTAGSVAVFTFDTPLRYNDGAWHHVVCTWDGTTGANKVQIYVDGVVVKQGTASAGTPGTGTDPFLIGAYAATFVSKFTGDLFGVQVYTLALTPTQVATHYAQRQWITGHLGDLTILQVNISQFSARDPTLMPTYDVTASSVRFSFMDLVRRLSRVASVSSIT